MIITNAFSLSMLCESRVVDCRKLDQTEATQAAREARATWDIGGEFVSAVGHADTAALFSRLLGVEIEPNRQSIVLRPGSMLLVGQYTGPRLPQGATELPAGATIDWWCVSVRMSDAENAAVDTAARAAREARETPWRYSGDDGGHFSDRAIGD